LGTPKKTEEKEEKTIRPGTDTFLKRLQT